MCAYYDYKTSKISLQKLKNTPEINKQLFKVLLKPMNNPLGISPSKGKQGTTRGKEKSFDLGGNRTHGLRIRSTITLPTELQGRTEKVGDECKPEKERESRNGIGRTRRESY